MILLSKKKKNNLMEELNNILNMNEQGENTVDKALSGLGERVGKGPFNQNLGYVKKSYEAPLLYNLIKKCNF